MNQKSRVQFIFKGKIATLNDSLEMDREISGMRRSCSPRQS
jgi:hypothetical protein